MHQTIGLTINQSKTWIYIAPLKKVKGKGRWDGVPFIGTPSQSYGTSLATWDHTVLPATQHSFTEAPVSK